MSMDLTTFQRNFWELRLELSSQLLIIVLPERSNTVTVAWLDSLLHNLLSRCVLQG